MLIELLHILSFILFLYVAVSTVYFLVFAVAGTFKRAAIYPAAAPESRFAILIPAYREDRIIVNTAEMACRHDYPYHLFQVIVIADSLESETIAKLKSTGAKVLEVDFIISTKAKALHAALQNLSASQFDAVMILDADNVMADGCLKKVNDAFCLGIRAVQCHRIAKNEENAVSFLGAVSEEINVNLFRRGQSALGFSAAPMGSGMAFRFDLLKHIFEAPGILDNAGEDREIDIELLKANVFMPFINTAYVYDEKVASTEVFEQQRIRWFEAQWNHARRFFMKDMAGLPRNAAYFNKLVQTLLIPRLLYFVVFSLVMLLFVLEWLTNLSFVSPSAGWWFCCMSVYSFVLLISIPGKFFNRKMVAAVFYLPVLIIFMLKAILQMKRQRAGFLHTSKSFTKK